MAAGISEFIHGILDAAWIIELLLSAASWVILCWEKRRWKTQLPAAVLLTVFQGCAGGLLYGVLGMSGAYPLLYKLIKGIIFFLFLHFFRGGQQRTKLLVFFALFNAMQTIAALAGQCSMLVGTYVCSGAPEGITRCVIECLIPLTALWLRKYDFDAFTAVPVNCVRMEAILCGEILIVGVAESRLFTSSDSVVFAFMASYFSLVVTSLVMIRAVYDMCAEQKNIIELQAEKQRFQSEREITRLAETTLEDLRCIRHDLKNQYAYMQILLSEKRYDELEAYFAKLQENLPPQLNMIDCGNRTVNTVLNMELTKLRADRITVEYQLVVPPVLPFPDGELCSVLANLLDNAGDECRKLRANGWQEPKIRLEIYPHQSYLYIRCLNSTDRTALDRSGSGLLTTKKDRQLHGYGTKIVAKLAEKYNGCSQYQLEDGMFAAQVMLDMTAGGEKHENEDRPV